MNLTSKHSIALINATRKFIYVQITLLYHPLKSQQICWQFYLNLWQCVKILEGKRSEGGGWMYKSAGRKSKLQARVLRCIRATPRGSKTTQEQKHMFSSNNKNKQGKPKMGEGVSYSGAEWVGKKSKFYAALATANICRRPLPSRQSSMPGGVVCTQVRKGKGALRVLWGGGEHRQPSMKYALPAAWLGTSSPLPSLESPFALAILHISV